MARASAYQKIGLFDERFGFCADVDMWMRLAERYRVAYVAEPLISLPARETVPRLDRERFWDQQRRLERMFWEGRMRHFQGRPWRRGARPVGPAPSWPWHGPITLRLRFAAPRSGAALPPRRPTGRLDPGH